MTYEFDQNGQAIDGSVAVKYQVLDGNRLELDFPGASIIQSYSVTGDRLTLTAVDNSNNCVLQRAGTSPQNQLIGKWNGRCSLDGGFSYFSSLDIRNDGTLIYGPYGYVVQYKVLGADHIQMTFASSGLGSVQAYRFSVSEAQLTLYPSFTAPCTLAKS